MANPELHRLASALDSGLPVVLPAELRHAALTLHAHIRGQRRVLGRAAYGTVEGDAHVLGARVGLGVATAHGVDLGGHTVAQVLRATVLGMEVGARVGLACAWTDRAAASSALPGAAAGAAMWASLSGSPVAPAVSRALAFAADGEITAAVTQGISAARSGDGDPAVDLAVPEFEGVWLSPQLVVPPLCVGVAVAVAAESVLEILQRHVRAAEKRLRAEQVERIELRVPVATWSAEQARPTLADAIGRLVAFHALGPRERLSTAVESEGARLDKADEIAHVAARVEVVHDWASSVGQVRSATPWVGELTWLRYRALRAEMKARGGWPGWAAADLPSLLRARPDTLNAGGRGPLAWPVQTKLYTTRGRWWTERRSESIHAPGAVPDIEDTAAASELVTL